MSPNDGKLIVSAASSYTVRFVSLSPVRTYAVAYRFDFINLATAGNFVETLVESFQELEGLGGVARRAPFGKAVNCQEDDGSFRNKLGDGSAAPASAATKSKLLC